MNRSNGIVRRAAHGLEEFGGGPFAPAFPLPQRRAFAPVALLERENVGR